MNNGKDVDRTGMREGKGSYILQRTEKTYKSLNL